MKLSTASRDQATIERYVSGQSDLIRIQTEIIDELAAALLLHISAAELGGMPCWDKMQRAMTMRAEGGE